MKLHFIRLLTLSFFSLLDIEIVQYFQLLFEQNFARPKRKTNQSLIFRQFLGQVDNKGFIKFLTVGF